METHIQYVYNVLFKLKIEDSASVVPYILFILYAVHHQTQEPDV